VLERPRGLGASRIDDHDPASALGDRVQLVLDPRRAHHAAVRDERVRADHQQHVGPRQVGDRKQERRAVEEGARREPIADVLGAGGVPVRRADGVEKALHPQRVGVRERARVAHVPADRVAAVLVDDPPEPRPDLVQRLVPRHGLQPTAAAPQRMEDAVGVVLNVGHRDPLGAREPRRQRVLGVGTDPRHLPVLDRDPQPAQRLADPAVGDPLLARDSGLGVVGHRWLAIVTDPNLFG
jgi:hypothetical protein